MRLLNPVMGDFNPFLPEYRADPYPFYRKLQSKHRVYVARLLGGATCVLPRYDDIVAARAATRFSVDPPQADVFKRLQPFRGLSPQFSEAINRTLLMVDPPVHTRLPRLGKKTLTPEGGG